MQSTLLKSIILFVGSCLLLVSFQNCGQPGGLSASDDLQKTSGNPLVVDVVAEMNNQEQEQQRDNPYDYGKKKYDDGKDCKYDDELEGVLNDYGCEDNAMGAKSKKVLICHYPPGNAAARHEICISRQALKAHLSHGHSHEGHMDHLGSCDEEPEVEL